MANITKVTGRHIWQEQRLHNPAHDDADARGFVKGLLCMNCRAYWFPGGPSPAVTGCNSDVDLRRCGTSRQQDHLEHEMRRREVHDRVLTHEQPDIVIEQVNRKDYERYLEQQGGLA